MIGLYAEDGSAYIPNGSGGIYLQSAIKASNAYRLYADPSSLSLTTVDANLKVNFRITAQSKIVNLSTQNGNLKVSYRINAQSEAVNVSPGSVGFGAHLTFRAKNTEITLSGDELSKFGPTWVRVD